MIDNYIPPDTPPAVVKFVDKHFPLREPKDEYDPIGRKIKYLTIWGKGELYIVYWKYNQITFTGQHPSFIYDCKKVRFTNKEEQALVKFLEPRFYGNEERPHFCTSH